MKNSSPRVLGLLVLKTLLWCAQTQDAVLTIEPKWKSFYNGESVTFICDMNDGEDTDWHYYIMWNGQEFVPYNQHKSYTSHLHQSGEYQCCGLQKYSRKTKCSNIAYLTVSANKPRAKLTAGPTTIPIGGSVTLSCSVETFAGWKYRYFRRTSDTPEEKVRTNNEETRVISVTQGGIYRCDGLRGNPSFYSDPSHDFTMKISYSNKVVVKRQPNWPQIFNEETITLTCEVQGGETTEWTCEWSRSGSVINRSHSKDWTLRVSESNTGDYMCQCTRKDDSYSLTQWSEAITLSVSDKPRANLSAGSTTIPVGGSVNLSCSVETHAGWKYRWFRRTSDTPENEVRTNNEETRVISVTQGGIYRCEARGNPSFSSQSSHDATINITYSNKVVLTQQPNWPQIFSGETITLTCEVQGGETTEWTCEWSRSGSVIEEIHSKDWTLRVSVSSSGDYMCRCRSRDDSYSSTKWSEAITLSVSVVSRSTFLALLIIRTISVIILIVLLLLWHCRKSKGLFCCRCRPSESSSSSQSSTNHGFIQTESHEYSSPLEDFTATYAEINHQTNAKKKKKGKKSPATRDTVVYSETRSGAALDNNTAM